MQVGKDVKLIDLGGVYNLADPKGTIYRTVGYDAPEYRDTGPTVASDLYSVGRTLAVLCTSFRGYQDTYASTLPPPAEVPLYATYDSLYRFLARATAEQPDDRFQSADEMVAQLEGVLREILATQRRHPVPAASTLFTSELHGQVEGPPWRSLPSLLVANDDAAAGFLATIAAEPGVIDLLRSAPEQTVEVRLRLVRALIDEQSYDQAIALLDEIHAGDPWEWRTNWYRGIAHLEMGLAPSAYEDFERVYYEVPGELAPKAALALAAESAGDLVTSARWADIVSRVDPSFTTAAMCLARDRLAASDRNGAIDAYDRVPASSSAYRDAQNAKVAALLGADGTSAGPASVNDLLRAAEIVARLPQGSDERERLAVDVFSAALRNVQLQRPSPNGMSPVILSRPFTERGIREGLEATYRSLARRSRTASERIALVDRANSVRPRTVV